jgi:N-acetylmuramoyl-L-alanine amidase
MKFKKIYSPNFDQFLNRNIKYIIIHYTGMKNQKVAIKRLQSKVAKVSAHYLISKRGTIYQMVEDQNVAWHAGESRWEKDINLNSKSIGIEIVNNGNEIFPNNQIKKLADLLNFLKKKYKIKKKYVLGHSHIAPKRKIDPGPMFPWNFLHKKGLSNLY